MIIGSHPDRRLLSICDPDRELPLADDLSSALARLDRLAHRRGDRRGPVAGNRRRTPCLRQ
jgi:hypothetical protein